MKRSYQPEIILVSFFAPQCTPEKLLLADVQNFHHQTKTVLGIFPFAIAFPYIYRLYLFAHLSLTAFPEK